jgi:hypothetical protein
MRLCYPVMPEPDTPQLDSSPAPPAAGWTPAPDGRGPRGSAPRPSVRGATHPRRRPTGFTPSAIARHTSPRAARTAARLVAPGPRSLWVPWPGLDPATRGRGEAGGIGRRVLPPCRPSPQRSPLESPETGAPRPAARRRGNRPLARRGTTAIPSRRASRTAWRHTFTWSAGRCRLRS